MFLKETKWALLWAFFILLLCSVPGKDIPTFSLLALLAFDKWVHLSVFFVLVILALKSFKKQTQYVYIQHNYEVIAFVCCVVYGAFLELMQQAFFKDRTADIYDFIANTFGTLLGYWYFKRRQKKLQAV